jgi:hypothetical protein
LQSALVSYTRRPPPSSVSTASCVLSARSCACCNREHETCCKSTLTSGQWRRSWRRRRCRRHQLRSSRRLHWRHTCRRRQNWRRPYLHRRQRQRRRRRRRRRRRLRLLTPTVIVCLTQQFTAPQALRRYSARTPPC